VKVIARTAEVEEGKRPGSDLVILDVEFLPASSQLLEFAIVEKVSGKVLIDTKVKHKNGLTFVSDKRNLFCEWISYRKACKVFGRKDPCVTGDGPDVDEIAEMLKNAGITHHTIILVWHTSNKDLSLLRNFLELAGHYGILPPDENCIRMIPLFRTNLPKVPGRNSFPARLDVLFPLFYPRHELIGMNHRALEDCLQTRLMILAFEVLCKSLEERGRGWQPTMLTKIGQKNLDYWLRKPPISITVQGESLSLES
jgi:hypothetical protein